MSRPDGVRLCGPDCEFPDVPHRVPEPDWIGDTPVMHGESDHQTGRDDLTGAYCLCGHPDYWTCPMWLNGGGLGGWTITRTDAPDVWDPAIPPGGYVCGTCRTPTESEPCPDHQPNAHQEATR